MFFTKSNIFNLSYIIKHCVYLNIRRRKKQKTLHGRKEVYFFFSDNPNTRSSDWNVLLMNEGWWRLEIYKRE